MGLNTDELKKRAEEKKSSAGGKYWKPEEGKRNVIRVLPRSLKYFTKEGDNDFAFSYYVHYNLFDVEGYKRIICKQSFGQKCPICDHAASFDDKKKAKNFRASHVYMYNVLDYETGDIKVFESGPFIYDEIIKFVVDPAWGELFDTKTGRDIVIEKKVVPQSKRGLENPYEVKPIPDRTDVTEALPDNWDELISGLQDRLPEPKDDAYYLAIVEHLRKGTLPAPVEKDKKEGNNSNHSGTATASAPAASEPAPAAAKKSDTPKQENPVCFGLEYSPRLEKCKPCFAKAACRDATLKL